MKNQDRTGAFQRNHQLENLLGDINSLVNPIEEQIISEFEEPAYPILFIVGPPRTGTTLMTQWLANLGHFCYPSNFLSRFFGVPAYAARIQQLMFNPTYAHKGEFADLLQAAVNFQSDIGKTSGAMAPHEFWYFWRRFFYFPDIPTDKATFLRTADFKRFKQELAAIQAVFGKPFFFKGLIINDYISIFNQFFPQVLFIHTYRDTVSNTLSLLNTREKFFGTIEKWYSFKTKSYPELEDKDPYTQIFRQITDTNESIETQFKDIAEERCLSVPYEEFCANPAHFYALMRSKLAAQGFELPTNYEGPKSFEVSQKPIPKRHQEGFRLLSV